MWGTPWIRQAIVALAISTIMWLVWLVLLVPAQRIMLRAVWCMVAKLV